MLLNILARETLEKPPTGKLLGETKNLKLATRGDKWGGQLEGQPTCSVFYELFLRRTQNAFYFLGLQAFSVCLLASLVVISPQASSV